MKYKTTLRNGLSLKIFILFDFHADVRKYIISGSFQNIMMSSSTKSASVKHSQINITHRTTLVRLICLSSDAVSSLDITILTNFSPTDYNES